VRGATPSLVHPWRAPIRAATVTRWRSSDQSAEGREPPTERRRSWPARTDDSIRDFAPSRTSSAPDDKPIRRLPLPTQGKAFCSSPALVRAVPP